MKMTKEIYDAVLKAESYAKQKTNTMSNQISINNRIFEVWVEERDNRQCAYIYEIINGNKEKMPFAGTNFGNMASFKNDILQWAKIHLSKHIVPTN